MRIEFGAYLGYLSDLSCAPEYTYEITGTYRFSFFLSSFK